MAVFASEEEFQKNLLSIFKRESEEHINSIIQGLLEIEKGGDQMDYSPIIDRLFRNAHSLKGSSRTMNLLQVEEICQEMEDIFHAIKKDRLRLSDSLIDVLHEICSSVEFIINNPDSPFPYQELLSRLKAFKDSKSRSSPAQFKGGLAGSAPALQTSKAGQSAENGLDIPPNKGQTAAKEFLKIEANKLEGLLQQMEELVSVKEAIRNNLSVISIIDKEMSSLIKGFKRMIDAGCYMQHQAIDSVVDELLKDFSALSQRLKSHHKRCLSDLHFVNFKTDDILLALKKVVMMPLNNLFESFPRMVRDIAKMQNKSVELIIEGGEIEIDRRILENIKDPIVHIIRNAIDHGIETPDERTGGGKNKTALIKISASINNGNEITIRIMDDGRGIDLKKLREKAIEKGIGSRDEIYALNDKEVLEIIFRPEVSTADIVTTISGRGLGLSIAREKTENLGGFITVRTEPLMGTMFNMTLPINLSTSRIILIMAFDGDLYGIHTRNIAATLRVKTEHMRLIDGRESVSFGGRNISVISLDEALERPSQRDNIDLLNTLLILSAEDKTIAFSVKEVLHEEEVFLKGLGRQLKRVRNISGAATISSGETILILNTTDLIRSAMKMGIASSYAMKDLSVAKKKKSILIAEDSITARTLFKGILEVAGYNVSTAVDGLEAWNMLKINSYDLLVSDVQMPRLNGFDLTAKIRADRDLFRLPVVLITGLETREDKERGIEVGANAYIVKSSFDQSNLLDVIKRLL